jgi:hypothetical protein
MAKRNTILKHQRLVIFQRLDYDMPSLLRSGETVAICHLEGEKLKDMILTVRERGWGLLVIETPSDEHWLIIAAAPPHEGNLVGDIRKWTQQYGYEFFIKHSGEFISPAREYAFVLPDGREIEIQSILTRASNLTHWGLSKARTLPAGSRAALAHGTLMDGLKRVFESSARILPEVITRF